MSSQTSISNGGYPAGAKIYRALLTQAGIAAPTEIVLTNTLGGVPRWSRYGIGSYRATLSNAFKSGRTIIECGSFYDALNGDLLVNATQRESNDTILLTVHSLVDVQLLDNRLHDTPIQIIVYP